MRENLFLALNKIEIALRHMTTKHLATQGLYPLQIQILLILNRRQYLSINQIAEELGVKTSSISDSVATLVKRNLLAKEPAKQDTRIKHISLTPEGKKIATKNFKEAISSLIGIEALPEGDLANVFNSLATIISELQKSGIISTSRMCFNCKYFEKNKYAKSKTQHHCHFLKKPIGNSDLQFDCNDFLTTTL